ncbi:MAG: hypothetical protein II887_06500 [Bacteroidales bacterium]|nr:hypothetical protein [Bacteroidales bacterium]
MNKLLFPLLAVVTAVPILWFFDIRIQALLWLSLVISILLLAFRYLVLRKVVKSYELSEDDELFSSNLSPLLFTLNGIGTRFYGSFRQEKDLYVTYEFLCVLFIPVIPIGCYLVSDMEDGSYKIYGKLTRRRYECTDIYLKWYGWLGCALSVLFLVIG